jgi:glycosyltransferase involved in cell wall biosynthesis
MRKDCPGFYHWWYARNYFRYCGRLLFQAENADALKECILFIIKNNNSLQGLKIAAREKVKNKFNIDKMVRDYNKFLAEHIKN